MSEQDEIRQRLKNKTPFANAHPIQALKCPKCGVKNENYKPICYACGSRLEVPAETSFDCLRLVYWVLGLILFLILVCAGCFLYLALLPRQPI